MDSVDAKTLAIVAAGTALGAGATYFSLSKKQNVNANPTALPQTGLPRLYIYDHCPFSTKARMIFGFKGIKHELIFMASDDFATPEALIGAKKAPILQLPDGTIMPESLDIVKYVDANLPGKLHTKAFLAKGSGDAQLEAWLKEANDAFYYLDHPRIAVAPLPEFALTDGRNYFKNKTEKTLGMSVERALDSLTASYVPVTEALLERLATLLHSTKSVNEKMSYDDLHVFAALRKMTLVKNLKWPPKVRAYMDHMSNATDIPLFDAMAKY